MTVLSTNIRRLRIELGFTQRELANEFPDITTSAVTLWENEHAKPSIDNLIILAKIFGVTVDELICNSTAETMNHQKERIKQDLIEAWSKIEATEKMKNQFNSWAIKERVEFLLTIDAVLNSDSNDPKDTALRNILAGEGTKNEKKRTRNKKAVRIVKSANRKKRAS